MTIPVPADALAEVARLVDEYRDRCLWFLDPRFVPTDLHEAIRTLDLIERYGDRAAFQRAAELRRWLSQLLAAPRRSRDIDLFHDSETALAATWEADGETLRALGYTLEVIRLAPAFVEALVARGADRSRMQWVRDSAPRFFPLIEDEVLGLALHPFDLATNKVLAMAGRLEPRDWIDVLTSDMKLQPLGFLVWAACGKDPGYNPVSLLGEMSRSHYSEAELDMLDFDGAPPDAAALSTHWHEALRSARDICGALPAVRLGACVVTSDGQLFRGNADDVRDAIERDRLGFHAGRIGGAWPSFR